MSSNQPSGINSSKSINTSGQISPAPSQTGPVAFGDQYGQRRSGSTGAGAVSRATPSPRNNQSQRKNHKPSKRYRLADEDAIAESAAMRGTNSRKGQTSITHLMNFSLPPRPQNHIHSSYNYGRNTRRNPTWGLGSGYHAVDKARYVHANYRFIVDPRGNYHAQSFDSDIHLDWNNVLQILASSQSQQASCPICLGVPVAPRMAKCGHIFCLPCLIRYMHSDDDTSHLPEKRARHKKCPICYDSIYISETRSVRWYTGQEGEPPREGGDVVLRLILREAGSTLAMPRDGAETLAKDEDIPWHFAAEVMDYARIMKGTEDYIMEQFDKDITELEVQEKEDELMFGDDNIEWVRKAIRMIRESKERVKGIGNKPVKPQKPAELKPKRAPIQFNEPNGGVPDMYLLSQAVIPGPSSSTTLSTSTIETPDTEISSNGPSAHNTISRNFSSSSASSTPSLHPRVRQHHDHQTSEYYFYQALSHYYLSPLDIRILKTAFGDYSSFPSTILPRVERVSTGHVVDDDLRKRTKYLAHLPYGCEVGFLECDWTDTVSPDVLEKFKPEIERRRKRNRDKETREEKARIKAERDEDEKRYAATRRRRPSFSGDKFSSDDFLPLSTADVADTAVSIDDESASTSPPWGSRHGKGSAFASLASPSTSPSAPRTVWGTAAIPPTSPTLAPVVPRVQDIQDDGWLQGWEKDLLQEDQLIMQAQALSLGESSKTGATSGGGKKKKAKKITLMSTNRRGGM
ncbi:hypothetical protein M501DRAFT_992092 [Patellaria atrata CBS 101060]|uniref:RING-type domain-containing protein n=1 Tax=Patellaria atrata CBS 101060 TaxID=1346257 RepID=A0A9P4SAH6_9PEZI|nr:hypothetical protein M501DRAFT_992092 [Patellaria atrata CBS 101060]